VVGGAGVVSLVLWLSEQVCRVIAGVTSFLPSLLDVVTLHLTQDTHVGLHHPQGKKVEWEKMFRHRDRRSLEPCEPESKTGPGGCRNHALLRWREDPFR